MKNVHVLPTEKPSTGYILGKCIKKLSDVKIGQFVKTHYMMFDKEYFQPQNIYITSDEDIKEGDWCLGMDGIFQYKGKVNLPDVELPKKIILTTDPDLIADGVQSIDDEFLEWFVKNQSCESVQVEKVEGRYVDYRGNVHTPISYEIIIPQEEPKQEWSPSQGEEVYLNVFSNWSKGVYIGYDVTKQAHIARDNSGYIILSSEILPYYAMLNEPKQEMAGKAFYESADKVIVVKRQERLKDIELEEVFGSSHCQFSVIENSLAKLYRNQEKILKAIKLLRNDD
jgi:hypothetical protein